MVCMVLLKVIFQITLAILDAIKEDLLRCKEDGAAVQTVNSFLESIVNREKLAEETAREEDAEAVVVEAGEKDAKVRRLCHLGATYIMSSHLFRWVKGTCGCLLEWLYIILRDQ